MKTHTIPEFLLKYNCDHLKRLLFAPVFKLFNKSTFLSSLNQNSCPVLDAEEIKKQEQKEAIEKLFNQKKALCRAKSSYEKRGQKFS